MDDQLSRRLKSVQAKLDEDQLDLLLVSDPENQFYLSGFAGGFTGARAFLLVTKEAAFLQVDLRYYSQALEEIDDFPVLPWRHHSYDEIGQSIDRSSIKRVGFEARHLSVAQLNKLQDALKGLELVPTLGLVEKFREVKDDQEIELIREAAAIADKGFAHILSFIEPGVTERSVALELEYFMRKAGAEKVSFDIIVASGARSAYPHADTSDKPLMNGDFVKMDFGAVAGYYCSDMTRTVALGEPSEQQRRVYAAVRSAQEEALEAVAVGKNCRDIDAVARDFLQESEYAEFFTHNLGHGVGLNVHEAPLIGPKSEQRIAIGMVITIEPGVYLPGFGGVRIEDMVVVGDAGNEIVTRSPKELIEL